MVQQRCYIKRFTLQQYKQTNKHINKVVIKRLIIKQTLPISNHHTLKKLSMTQIDRQTDIQEVPQAESSYAVQVIEQTKQEVGLNVASIEPVKKPEIEQQKLQVQVFDKNTLQNPQSQLGMTSDLHENKSPYGPFHEISQNAKNLLQEQPSNHQSHSNYEYNIAPILSNISPLQKKSPFKTRTNAKTKKSQSILTEESTHEQTPKVNPSQLEKEILQLAKNIRKKVWKKDSPKVEKNVSQVNNSSRFIANKKAQHNQTQIKLRKLYQKRQSLFQKYSYPRTVGVDLSELERKEERLKLGKYSISRVCNEEQHEESQENLQASPQSLLHPLTPSPSHPQQHPPTQHKTELPKLNFDKTHHKYKVTEFRKSILRENKQREIAKSMILKEKEETLQKRREVYNTSRYRPVGVRLGRIEGKDVKEVEKDVKMEGKKNELRRDQVPKVEQLIHVDPTMPTHAQPQQANPLLQAPTSQALTQRPNTSTQPHPYSFTRPDTTLPPPSCTKSSLTFNFSFSDPLTSLPAKSPSQVYNQVQSLTRMLENDSSPEEKLNRLKKEQTINIASNPEHKQVVRTKKWSPIQIEKEMTESKTIEGLHNSSNDDYDHDDFDGHENGYRDVELEYSSYV